MKGFFLSRALREKLLLLALVVAAAAMWMTSAGKRAGKSWRTVQATSAELKNQEMVLGEKDGIEGRADAALKQIDPNRTFDSLRLQSEVNTIANASGITNRQISPQPQERTSQFALNSVQINVRNSDYNALKNFYVELKKRAPYIGIEQFDVNASPGNPASLNAMMRISSVEILK